MLPSQRHLFDIPNDIVYLNTAYMSPLLNSVVKAIDGGTRVKARPWNIKSENFYDDIDMARELFARLINTSFNNVAIVPSASYGIQIAANNINIEKGKIILLLKDQFPSNVYPWQKLSEKTGAEIQQVQQGTSSSLTDSVLNNLNERVAVTALPNVLWTNGTSIDLMRIRSRCDEVGSRLVLDLTQSAGAMSIDFGKVRPDFAVVANYKWMLGPYTTGFLFVSPHFFDGIPLEEGWITRKDSKDFSNLINYTDQYESGAIRFDMGERSNFALIPGVIAALKQIEIWGVDSIEEKLKYQNNFLGSQLKNLGLQLIDERQRAPHFLGAILPRGTRQDLIPKLAEKNIYLSERAGTLRITPHLWNSKRDFEKLISELAALL